METLKEWVLVCHHKGDEPFDIDKQHGLFADERDVVTDVLTTHFNTVERGEYTFEWLDPSTLPPLKRIRRQRPSADLAGALVEALSTPRMPLPGLSEEQEQRVFVRAVAAMVIREVRQLRDELGLNRGPIIGGSSVLTKVSREELTDHLLQLDLTNPTWPTDSMPLPEQPAKPPEVNPKPLSNDDPDDTQPPALTDAERWTLQALAGFDPADLAKASRVSDAMPLEQHLSERTIRQAIKRLVSLGFAERPEGEKQGARLTMRGRRLATKIAD